MLIEKKKSIFPFEEGKELVALTGLTPFFQRKRTPSYTLSELWNANLGSHRDKMPTAEQASQVDKNQARQTPYLDIPET